ncbi:MAG: hypothetical protein JRG86_06425 [Deltaproteobacteria bacterium]|nr:hypothetical protein [Deltaproteobacteria bacterium]
MIPRIFISLLQAGYSPMGLSLERIITEMENFLPRPRLAEVSLREGTSALEIDACLTKSFGRSSSSERAMPAVC